jgi:hypothetical protein
MCLLNNYNREVSRELACPIKVKHLIDVNTGRQHACALANARRWACVSTL